jgi:hypothetical protein
MSVTQTQDENVAKPASKTLSLVTMKTMEKENMLNGQLKRNPTQAKKPGTKKTFGMKILFVVCVLFTCRVPSKQCTTIIWESRESASR